jgi:hypothetical protein
MPHSYYYYFYFGSIRREAVAANKRIGIDTVTPMAFFPGRLEAGAATVEDVEVAGWLIGHRLTSRQASVMLGALWQCWSVDKGGV